MQLITVVAPVFGAQCCVLVHDDGTCVVVDAGAGVCDSVVDLVATRGLRPVAVLATHGHVDHTWDAAHLSDAFGVPVVLHAADAYRLSDPFGTLGVLGHAVHDPRGPLAQALAAADLDPSTYKAPARIETFGAATGTRNPDVTLELGSLRIVARHAPGHTEGSTLYLVDVDEDRVALTGDVLFAGTIGRTDLPGGNHATMEATLREVVALLPPETIVVPGHGPTSTIAAELAGNPFLKR